MYHNNITEISILIPTYNFICKNLVVCLQKQAETITKLSSKRLVYEIIVADDGSTNRNSIFENRMINNLNHCQYIICDHNRGRAGIRNFLATTSHYRYLLFLDSDMTILNENFISRYIEHDSDASIIYGGIVIGNNDSIKYSNLRYKYEKAAEKHFAPSQRKDNPYHNFHTANFLIERNIMLRFPFDERFHRYGYEDVLFGKTLAKNNIRIYHINNPVVFDDFEDNISFIEKTEEALRTLYDFRNELYGYSTLLNGIEMLNKRHFLWILRLFHTLFGNIERKNLIGTRPSLTYFTLYKLGFYLSLTKNK
jgi:glycosyltransferase involved in cell wall biosynthesis